MNNSGWIKVEDRLPENQSLEDEDNYYVWGYVERYGAMKIMYADGAWHKDYASTIRHPVTHWQSLPEPPE